MPYIIVRCAGDDFSEPAGEGDGAGTPGRTAGIGPGVRVRSGGPTRGTPTAVLPGGACGGVDGVRPAPSFV
ncbi:MAG TPA: hypothetical protein VL400_19710, partial [Polyangiaceae bacterium]|nr:hypothetical protein [Polyangiaceae bacterium]